MKYAAKNRELKPSFPAPGIERRVVHTPNLMMADVAFKRGRQSEPDPFHTHPHEQVSFIVSGEILFLAGEEEPVYLSEGDYFFVPANIRHAIQCLTDYVRIIDCFTPIREDFVKP
ncbi:MAG TPA: cupin domain-containing protein [Prolixibacteraceae bacterium]|nr:cupin domain-containing protein [Prolixibacteraceae bacterium]